MKLLFPFPNCQNTILLICTTLLFVSACSQNNESTPLNEPENITRVVLNFHNQDTQENIWATYEDPDGEGGDAPTVDPVELEAGAGYKMLVLFYDDLAPEGSVSINRQMIIEDLEHQLCFTTTGTVPDPLPQDFDDNGEPVGLNSILVPTQDGVGTLKITLLHRPDKAAADACGTGIIDVETLAFPVTIK